MRKIILGMLFSIATAAQLSAWQPDFSFDLTGGYRRDFFSWEISRDFSSSNGNHHHHRHHHNDEHHRHHNDNHHHNRHHRHKDSSDDDILTKISWHNMKMWQIGGTWRFVLCRTAYFRLSGDYGKIYQGRLKGHDFGFHEREILETKADANRGEVFDLSAGIGYLFWFVGNKVTLAPIIGYSHQEQHFRMNNLYAEFGEISGFIDGLQSNYRSRWTGPWIGMDFTYDTGCCIRFLGYGEYHYGRFRGKGHWNLRADFEDQDFRQHADAQGGEGMVGMYYDVAPNLAVGITGTYVVWQSRSGKDDSCVSGDRNELELRRARWQSWQWMAALEYYY